MDSTIQHIEQSLESNELLQFIVDHLVELMISKDESK